MSAPVICRQTAIRDNGDAYRPVGKRRHRPRQKEGKVRDRKNRYSPMPRFEPGESNGG